MVGTSHAVHTPPPDEPVEILGPEPSPDAAGRIRELDDRIRAVVTEYPVASLLAAVAIGFTVGRALRRWT